MQFAVLAAASERDGVIGWTTGGTSVRYHRRVRTAIAIGLAMMACGARPPTTVPAAAAPPPTVDAAAAEPVVAVVEPVPAPVPLDRGTRMAAIVGATRHDPRLDAVAVVAARSAQRELIGAVAVHAAMARELHTNLMPYLLAARGDDNAVIAQLARAMGELRSSVALDAVGWATVGTYTVLVATAAPTVVVEVTREGGAARVRFVWPFAVAPAVFGDSPLLTRRLATQRRGDVVELVLDCKRNAGIALEIDAGPQVVASVADPCGPGPTPPFPAVELGPPARTRVELEQRLFELINRARVEEGLGALRWEPTALDVARAHAADMAARQAIGHGGSDGSDLATRLDRGQVVYHQGFENVGRAAGPGEAHLAFLASPGHRANLLTTSSTSGAVGAVIDPVTTDAYIVELFLAPPPPPPPRR